MIDIDFLPTRYKERRARLRAHVWHGATLTLVVVIVASLSAAQYMVGSSVASDLADVEAKYPQVMAELNRVNELRRELSEADNYAALYTYLVHPWPRSQLLSAITNAIPESVVLTEVDIEAPSVANGWSIRVPDANAAAGTPAAPPAEADLNTLRSRCEVTPTIVRLTGMSDSLVELHQFTAALAHCPLFSSAKLESVASERLTTSEETINRFELRLVIARGHDGSGADAAQQSLNAVVQK